MLCTRDRFRVLVSSRLVTAQSVVSISSLSAPTVATFGSLTITGTGFDPANGAISVTIVAGEGGSATVPVYFADATSIKVITPPLFETTTASLFDVPVVADIQVVQVTSSSVSTSNVLGGLIVEPLPSIPNSVATGLMTRAFLHVTKAVQNDLRTALAPFPQFSDLVLASEAFDVELQILIDAATAIADNPERTVTLNTPTDHALVLTVDALRVADRIAAGIVREVPKHLEHPAVRQQPSGGLSLLSGFVAPDGLGRGSQVRGLHIAHASWRDPLAGCSCRGRLHRDRAHM